MNPSINNKQSITSVLIPAYNHEKFIENALNSLVSDQSKNIEIIVSDDCSNDNTFEIANYWCQNNRELFYSCKIVSNLVNKGVNENLNILLSLATGDYVTFLASDDEFHIDSITLVSNYLDLHANVDFVYTNISLMDSEGRDFIIKYLTPNANKYLKNQICLCMEILFHWRFPWNRVFGRRIKTLKFGSIPTQYSYEDRWMALNILNNGNYTYYDILTYKYRMKLKSDNYNSKNSNLTYQTSQGFDSARMHNESLQIEQDILNQSKGLLRLLLRIRVSSNHFILKNIFFIFSRYAIAAIHRFIIIFL